VAIWIGFALVVSRTTRPNANHPFKIALLLLALLPAQIALQWGIAYLMPRESSQRIIEVNGNLQLDPHVEYSLADISRHPIAHYILVVTGNAFFLGFLILCVAIVRRMIVRHKSTNALHPIHP
jgi:hypothetical protein